MRKTGPRSRQRGRLPFVLVGVEGHGIVPKGIRDIERGRVWVLHDETVEVTLVFPADDDPGSDWGGRLTSRSLFGPSTASVDDGLVACEAPLVLLALGAAPEDFERIARRVGPVRPEAGLGDKAEGRRPWEAQEPDTVPRADRAGGPLPQRVADRKGTRVDNDRRPPGLFLLVKGPCERAESIACAVRPRLSERAWG